MSRLLNRRKFIDFPMTLFRGGGRGFYWDFDDVSTLYNENTFPTTRISGIGSDIGTIFDKSGNGYFGQSYIVDGPKYRISSRGFGHGKKGTGADLGIQTRTDFAQQLLQNVSDVTIILGIYFTEWSNQQIVFRIWDGNGSEKFIVRHGATSSTLRFQVYAATWPSGVTETIDVSFDCTNSGAHIEYYQGYQSGSWYIKLNNILVGFGTFTGGANSQTVGTPAIYFGDGSASREEMHYALFLNRPISQNESQQAYDYFKNRLGLN